MGFVVLLILILIGVAVATWYIYTYNRFIRLDNDVEEAEASIDVYLKKRHDLIPNLVNTVKGYAAHETAVFDAVNAARSEIAAARSPEERQAGEEKLTGALQGVLALAEAYPDLKSSANFLELQGELSHIESELASARRYYNANVKLFNTMLRTWPSSAIARQRGWGKKPYWQADPEDRANVDVSFR